MNETLQELSSALEKEKEIRENLLNKTTEELNLHAVRMVDYNKMKTSIHELTEKLVKEEMNKEVALSKYEEALHKLELKEKEMQDIMKTNETLNKRNRTLKSLLQMMIDTYHIDEVSKMLGISPSKIKEYLQD